MQDGIPKPVDIGRPYEKGVLFIHGIGQQTRGDTLLAFGGPLLRFLHRAGEILRETGKTIIKPDPIDPVAPAHTSISLRGDDKPSLLLAESCWAESFPAPEFRKVAKWALLALPWTLASEFARKLEPITSKEGALLRRYPRYGLSLLSHLVVFFGGALVCIFVMLLLLLALLPIPKLRDFLLMIQLRIAAIVGDCYVLLDSPIIAGAIVSRVCRDLDWMAQRCERVSLVAHSQGAAVAHRVIRRLEDTRDPLLNQIDLYFSFGSGLGKLHDIQSAFRSSGWKLIAGYVLMISVILISFAIPIGFLTRGAPSYWAMGLYFLAYAGFYIMLIFFSIHSTEERDALLLKSFKCQNDPDQASTADEDGQVEWVDRYASNDPVPGGPVFIEPSNKIDSCVVYNRGSIFADHTTYTENADEFIRVLAHKLGLLKNASRLPYSDEAKNRRQWRVRWLLAARLLALATFLLLIFGLYDRLHQYGRELLEMLSSISFLIPFAYGENGEIIASGDTLRVLGLTVVGFAVFAWDRLVLLSTWSLWGKRDLTRSLRGDGLDYGGIIFLLFTLLTVLLPFAGVMLWIKDFDFDSVLQPINQLQSMWESYTFGLVMQLIFAPLTAVFAWWFLNAHAKDKYRISYPHNIGLEGFLLILLGIILFASVSIIWFGLQFPDALQLCEGEFWAECEEVIPISTQFFKISVLFAPYIIAFFIVSTIGFTIGAPIGKFLSATSRGIHDREREGPEPHSALTMSIICSVSAVVAFLVHKSALTIGEKYPEMATAIIWTDLGLLSVIWMISALSGINAVIREERKQKKHTLRVDDKSLTHGLGMNGMILMAVSVVWATSTIGTIG